MVRCSIIKIVLLRGFLRPIRLGAGMALVLALCLPLGECSHDGNAGSPPAKQTLQTELFPRSDSAVEYMYAGYAAMGGCFGWLAGGKFSWLGPATLLAFTWPMVSVLVGRKWMESRFSWIYHLAELLLCAGTGYLLYIITCFYTWLYGAYVVVISAGLFACTALVFLSCSAWRGWRKWRERSRRRGQAVAEPAPGG